MNSVYDNIVLAILTILMNRQNIIIGGGITGMYLAYQLCKNNEKVMVLERNKRTGGLLEGFEISGNSLEKTYHHLFKSDKKAHVLHRRTTADFKKP